MLQRCVQPTHQATHHPLIDNILHAARPPCSLHIHLSQGACLDPTAYSPQPLFVDILNAPPSPRPPSGCKSHYVFTAIAGSILQYQGTQQGFLFDPATMTPR